MTNDEVQLNINDVITLTEQITPQQLLLYASTTAVYEGQQDANESCTLVEDQLDAYSRSMLLRERRLEELCKQRGLRAVGLRLATVVGVSPPSKIGPCSFTYA